jgi:hypothetical protein
LQIFLARWSFILLWRGTALRLFGDGLCHVRQFVARALLTVDARDFFDPANPLTVLLHYSRAALVHADTSKTNCTSAKDSTIQQPNVSDE